MSSVPAAKAGSPAASPARRIRGNRQSPRECRLDAADRARSSAWGNWFDCTPTRPTMPKPSLSRNRSIIFLTFTRVLVSSTALMSIAMSGPRTPRCARVVRERIKISERVRGNRRSPPLDDIAVVVVMRRFDQDKLKTPLGPRRCEHGHTRQCQNFFIFSHNSEDGNRACATAPPVVGAGATHVSVGPKASVAAGNSDVGSAPKCRNYLRFSNSDPSVMGPMRSSPPSNRHAAELTLLSVVGAEAATLCC